LNPKSNLQTSEVARSRRRSAPPAVQNRGKSSAVSLCRRFDSYRCHQSDIYRLSRRHRGRGSQLELLGGDSRAATHQGARPRAANLESDRMRESK